MTEPGLEAGSPAAINKLGLDNRSCEREKALSSIKTAELTSPQWKGTKGVKGKKKKKGGQGGPLAGVAVDGTDQLENINEHLIRGFAG